MVFDSFYKMDRRLLSEGCLIQKRAKFLFSLRDGMHLSIQNGGDAMYVTHNEMYTFVTLVFVIATYFNNKKK